MKGIVELEGTTLQARVGELVREHGSLRKAADAVQVDVAYLYRLSKGIKVNPSADVLERLGLVAVKIIMYAKGHVT